MKQIYVLTMGSSPLMYSTNFQAIYLSLKNFIGNSPFNKILSYTALIGKARKGIPIEIITEVDCQYVIKKITVHNKPQDLDKLNK